MRTAGGLLEEISLIDVDADARRDARILLSHVLGASGALALDPRRPVSAEEESVFGWLWTRRLRGEPVQYILGEWDFFGRSFRVDARALIPRPETEHLVEEASREAPRAVRVLDLGCGSGALAVTLALELPRAKVLGVDVSAGALALSRENAMRHGVSDRVRFLGSDWMSAAGNVRFDLIVSNPPYVSIRDRESLPAGVRDFEPDVALFAGDDGLSEIRTLLSRLPRFLDPGGAFLFEFGFGQADAVAGEIESSGAWRLRRIVPDLAGIPRVAVLRRDESPR